MMSRKMELTDSFKFLEKTWRSRGHLKLVLKPSAGAFEPLLPWRRATHRSQKVCPQGSVTGAVRGSEQ